MKDKKELLNGFLVDTKNQIAVFDQKAGIMLTVIGIMFALITYFCDIFSSEPFVKGTLLNQRLYIFFFIAFCVSSVFALACFVLVIVPRKKPKSKDNNKNKHINYYMDGATLNSDEFDKLLDKYVLDNNALIQQVINNDIICRQKHLFLLVGIYSLAPFITFTLLMLSFIVFVF